MKMNKITTFSVILLGVIIPPPQKKNKEYLTKPLYWVKETSL